MGSTKRENFRTDIPTYDVTMVNFIGRVIDNFIDNDSLQKMIPRVKTVHRGQVRNVKGPEPLDQDFFTTEATSSLDFRDISTTNICRFTEYLCEFALQSLSELSRGFFLSLDQVVDRTGQVVNGNGKLPSFDLILDMLEKIDIEFDTNGNPIKPTLVMHPKLFEKVKEMPKTAEQVKREKEIMERKREDYFASKRTRRLS